MKRKKAIFFVLFGSDLGCVCVCVCVRACVRGRGGALLSLIGMFTNLSNVICPTYVFVCPTSPGVPGMDSVLGKWWVIKFQDRTLGQS